jgi:nucleotide-binding universal stress UspA family protein
MRDARPQQILAALDDADITPRVVEWSRYLATRFGADLTGIHVMTSAVFSHFALHVGAEDGPVTLAPTAIQERLTREGVRWLRSALGSASGSTSVDAEVGFGWVAHEIVAAAERVNSDLIIVGRAGSGLGTRMLIGAMTRQVLRSALCPVLVVSEVV